MPRVARLDAPGALHHVIARGIEHRDIFWDDTDRNDFLARVRTLFPATGTTLYAWSLLSNHFHLLARSGPAGLSRTMQRLLGGYVTAFNDRHDRSGHLFQNRFKSILVEEEAYFLALVRYIHLNPLRAGIVAGLDGLARYPWSGHAGLLGRRSVDVQATECVLRRFGPDPASARAAYCAFLQHGLEEAAPPDLEGGGLRRSAGGWEAVARLTRGREDWAFDERVLGSSAFVAEVLGRTQASAERRPTAPEPAAIDHLCTEVARRLHVGTAEITSPSRRHNAVVARALVAFLAVHRYGFTQSAVAEVLRVSKQTVFRGLALAEQLLPLVARELSDLLPEHLVPPPPQSAA